MGDRRTFMITQPLERFVNADEAAEFLSVTRRRVLDLARRKLLPSHSIGTGARRVWRFRLSELSAAIDATQKNHFASPQKARIVRPPAVPGRARK
jgi:hypothetical protein